MPDPRQVETGRTNSCHWYEDGHGGRYLIPGCMGRVHDPDSGSCTCEMLDARLERAARQIEALKKSWASLQGWHDQIVRAIHDHPDGTVIMKAAADQIIDHPPGPGPLTGREPAMFGFALEMAEEEILARNLEIPDRDRVALDSLQRFVGE